MTKATILAVDDTPGSLMLLVRILTPAGYDVHPAESGELALAAVAANPPDLILLDVRMKGMDGLEVCRRLKAREETRHIPVILISAFADTKEWVAGLEAGAADYLTKPFRTEDLLSRVATHLSLRRATVALEHQTATLHLTNERLEAETLGRQRLESEVRQSLYRAERSRRAILSTLEDQKQAEEELRLRNVILSTQQEASLDGILVVDPNGKIISSNHRFAQMWGLPQGVVESRPDERLHSVTEKVGDPEEFLGKVKHLNAHPDESSRDDILLKDGRTFDRNSAPMVGAGGKLFGRVWYFRDITARRLADEALRQSEAKYRELTENLNDVVFSADARGVCTYVSPPVFAMAGFKPEELVGRLFSEAFHVDDVPGLQRSLKGILENHQQTWEFGFRTKAGVSRWARASSRSIVEGGRVTGLTGVFSDITDRKLADEALRQSEAKYRELAENLNDAVFAVDGEGVFTYISASVFSLAGYTPEELVGRRFSEVVHPDDLPGVEKSFRETLGNHLEPWEFRCRTKGGGYLWARSSSRPIVKDDRVTGLRGVISDVTDRKQAEEDRERLTTAIEQAAEVVFVTDAQGLIVYVNPAFETVTGHARAGVLGHNPRLLKSGVQDEAFYRTLWKTISAGKTWRGRLINKKKDGSLFTEEATISPVRNGAGTITSYVAVKRDITRDLGLEAQLLQSQKMEAIGSLAGGVAHDFNNLLSVILIYTGLAIDAAPDGDPRKDDLLEVRKAAKRAESLTRQLLAFSRKQVLQPVPLNLNETAAGVEKMLRRILGEDISFVQKLAPDLGIVQADPGQIEQVLMNLAVNSRDAMPEGGKLTIETSNLEVDEEFSARHVALSPGPYVVLAVTDTGTGMDEQTKAKLFEPFFTTKAKGKGTGLGLSTVYGIVKQSGGNIAVYSELGHGTTFRIYLPRALSATAAPVARPPVPPRRTTGTETIVVAEDEEALRKVAVRSLVAAGYTVLSAADGDEALEVCERHAGSIDLLLTDVVMPKMSGRALAQGLSKARPAIKVVYMSGYTDNAIVHHGVLDAGTQFLAKPFTSADLTQKVREVLDAGSTDLAERPPPAAQTDAAVEEPQPDKEALRALPRDILVKLRKAVIAARYDEIVEQVETIRATQPAVAVGLRRMADLFDYEGLRDLLSQWKEEPRG